MTEVIKPKMMDYHRHLLVCIGERCTKNGEGQALYNELKVKLKEAGLDKGNLRVKRTRATCFGTCKSGPLLCVQPEGVWYYDITSEKLDRIIKEHFIQGKPVTEYIHHQA
ncbi:MAG: (2Fe-2S) ferredoxin domain-containing protein [Methylococcales symbiont of Hymedesmia sp. n. MRB-2018]|nr:MAG: (2Fe-2S) ferredoxin domain-containing protein [Methylococcales symbiont of Hymedesmia sp. n. MRB-2018]KAF3984341.1 MAG: (2Fe-2S) ferredoxin domain-containing protein [Methylococcales symbiont of Hymedesmia sp. n. MRB-2018]